MALGRPMMIILTFSFLQKHLFFKTEGCFIMSKPSKSYSSRPSTGGRPTTRASAKAKKVELTVPAVVDVVFFEEKESPRKSVSGKRKTSSDIICIKIDICNGEVQSLLVRRDSSPVVLATQFCEDHIVAPTFIPLISSFIEENLARFGDYEARAVRDNPDSAKTNEQSETSAIADAPVAVGHRPGVLLAFEPPGLASPIRKTMRSDLERLSPSNTAEGSRVSNRSPDGDKTHSDVQAKIDQMPESEEDQALRSKIHALFARSHTEHGNTQPANGNELNHAASEPAMTLEEV